MSDVSPISERLIDATREGALAWRSGSALGDNPCTDDLERLAWEVAFREARGDAAQRMLSDLAVIGCNDEEKDQD